jgi:hydroxymethylbilane synthase
MSVLHIDAVSQTTSPQRTFVLASRPSKLALIQTHAVLAPLRSAFPALTFDTLAISSTADRNQVQALHAMGGAGIFTSDLEAALMRGDADILVHSLKDMPTVRSESREIAAIMQRENPVDCLVVKAGLGYKTLGELPDGSVIGTGSVRRVAQLKRHFPELEFLLVVSVVSVIYFTVNTFPDDADNILS